MTHRLRSMRPAVVLLLACAAVLVAAGGCARRPAPRPADVAPAPYARYDVVFAVAGDSRSDHDEYTTDTAKYVTTEALAELHDDLLPWSGAPGFFLAHVGDFGYRGGTGVFEAFKGALMPSDAVTFPVHVAMGNHDLMYEKVEDESESERYPNARRAQAEATRAFAPWMPPGASSPDPDQAGLTYAFRSEDGSTAFVFLDAYYASAENEEVQLGYYSDAVLVWLRDTLDAYRSDPAVRHIFVLSHQPAFHQYANGVDDGQGTLYDQYSNGHDGNLSARSNWILWGLMDTYKVDAFFAGHTHFYQRWNVQGTAWGDRWGSGGSAGWPALPATLGAGLLERYQARPGWETTIPHVLNGRAGAPPKPLPAAASPASKVAVPAEALSADHNFSIVYVRGDTVTVDVYSFGNGEETATNRYWKPRLIDKFRGAGGSWESLPLTPERP